VRLPFLLCLLLGAVTVPLAAQTQVPGLELEPDQARILQVGLRVAPPFVIPLPAGGYDGLAVRLWEAMAEELGVDYVYHERGIRELFDDTASGALDVAVGALTITAEREERVDFTHSWYRTGLGVAASTRHDSGWWRVLRLFFSPGFLLALLALISVLVFWGTLLWFAERRANREQFDARPLHGIGSGMWWAAVTMTTVGYGDKAPRSLLGRMIGLVWMFVALITVSTFTAMIASSLTVGHLETRVTSAADLRRVQVGALPGTTAAQWLEHRGIAFSPFDGLPQALQALDRGEVEAVVSDQALIRYQLQEGGLRRLQALPFTLDVQDYGFAVGEGSTLREPLNRALLSVSHGPEWARWYRSFLGH
jgi:polar amino acid transport system substrate-binding protein